MTRVERHCITDRCRGYPRRQQNQIPSFTEHQLQIRGETRTRIVNRDVLLVLVPCSTLDDEIDLLNTQEGNVETEHDRRGTNHRQQQREMIE